MLSQSRLDTTTPMAKFLLLNFSVLALLFAVDDVAARVDLTVREKATRSAVVDAVVDLIVQSCIFDNDRLLLRRIAFAETEDGKHSRTFTRNGADFYGGIWQVDEASFTASKSSFDNTVYDNIKNAFAVDWKQAQYQDLWKPLYSGLAARMKIARSFSGRDIPQGVDDQAGYWKNSYTINSWTNAEKIYTDASNAVSTKCTSPKADVVFVVDSSGSILRDNFELVKSFVSEVVGSFEIKKNKVRVAMIQFSNTAILEFDLEEHSNVADVQSAVNNMLYIGGGTNSSGALKEMSSLIQQQGRHGVGVPVSSIFLTDGQSNDKSATKIQAASVHSQLPEVSVFVVGVTSGIDETELEAIASDPDCLHVYHLSSFSDITPFADQIMGQACKTSAHLKQGSEISGVLEKGEHYYFKITVLQTEGGVRTKVKVNAGGVKLYFSYKIQNPNAALYDYIADITSDDGEESTFIPWSDEAASKSNADQNVRKKRSTDQGQDATLYGAVVGEQEGQNEFTLSYIDSAVKNTGNFLVAALSSLVVAYRVLFSSY